ncbi:hypothetical protein BBJ29_000273 [Phytophthora kernoviae]|uniref:EF-hand domain-containing protein n=1 Tax=Phytophthora kernoviae TaxID=325452 RepID=A0A3F2S064_9STRA|nr:hypothetical protein BBJ29_000273 [Phytophthora kernoviae]RLN67745.1 hypothetical protein BBP00_00001465 [Phytophthora kernoviae]
MIALESQLETTLYKYRKIQNFTLLKETVKPEEMAGNMPLNLFLFSLNSFCSTLLNFQQSHNSKIYNDVHRIRALKVTLAIVSGVFMAVYVYGFSASVPSTIAYIMGGHLGGSFRTTVNRVGGVVAGSVVPSVFKFFFVQVCEPKFLGVVLSNIVMFVWRVLEISHRLLNNNYLLFKLVRWFHFRVTQNRVKLNSADIHDESLESLDNTSADCHKKWQLSCNHFQALVQDSFETMEVVFSDSFQYSDPDEMAVFMQMKEAFRLAGKDCSGELNADDVATMLETIFAQSGAVKKEEIGLYVQQFMAVVGKPDCDTVSFEEFMSALEHGLTLEVEVYRRRKPRAPALVAHTLQAKEEVQSGDTKELETSRFSTCPSENASMLLRREYDVLNVEDFSISDVVVNMKSAYVEWLTADKRYERVSMEEQLLLNCLVSSAESIAKSLAGLEEIAMSS